MKYPITKCWIEFIDPQPMPSSKNCNNQDYEKQNKIISPVNEGVVPLENPPETLLQWAVLIFDTSDPILKVFSSAIAYFSHS